MKARTKRAPAQPEPARPDKLLLTALEAAKLLSVDRSTLYKWSMAGEIPSLKLGRNRRWSYRALVNWIGAKERESKWHQWGSGEGA